MTNKIAPYLSDAFKSMFDRVALAVGNNFDPVWYGAQCGLKLEVKSELLVHFLLVGLGNNASPTPIFDPAWYKDPTDNHAVSSFSFVKFLENGWIKGNSPHPIFDLDFYAEQIKEDLNQLPDPITHFRQFGWKMGLMPHPLFDPIFYLGQNGVEMTGLDDPLSHYLRIGNAMGYVTSPHFDTAWHRAAYQNFGNVQKDALVDYVTRGHAEGRRPNKAFDAARYAEMTPDLPTQTDALTDFLKRGQFRSNCLPPGVEFNTTTGFATDPIYLSKSSHFPLVSIIITNLNGSRHLPDLFASLAEQSYRNFEIIFVDDGSSDNSVSEAQRLGYARVVQSPAQTGFAAANNAGLVVARGEFIALLNNDVKVSNSWLESLVTRLSSDHRIGAVTSKVRFWGKFSRLRLTAKTPFAIRHDGVVRGLDYKKLFVRLGEHKNEELSAVQHGEDNFILEIDVPSSETNVTLPLVQASRDISVLIDGLPSRQSKIGRELGSSLLSVALNPSPAKGRSGFYIINNAGTAETMEGMPIDRGLGEVDAGQYDFPQETPYFCGCSVLVRRTALKGKKLFVGEFFAYYEDSELSLRLRRSGYKIFYEPASVVEHRHSSTTVEKSTFWLKHTWKNSALFRYILTEQRDDKIIESERLRLNHMRLWYKNQATSTEQELKFADIIPDMSDEMVSIAQKLKDGILPERNGIRVGMFNPYWNTLGGGEAHALNVANILRNGDLVELISTEDFDLEGVCDFFGISSDPFIKRLVTEMTQEVTEEYDIFINSCYQSTLPSKADKSYYIVSFPGRTATQDFTSSYKFLPNSMFTRQWMLRYWPVNRVNEKVIYPLVPEAFYLRKVTSTTKKAIILSVGRFASGGHVKNQLEIAEVFRRLSEGQAIARHWKLVLIGSANDLTYIEKVRLVLQGTNNEILVDASFDTVISHYAEASIYVHASGLGQDLQSNPERAEHFGMAVAQAAAAGCVPIVFNGAGPAEIVSTLGMGETFDNERDMERILLERCRAFEAEGVSIEQVRSIVKAASIFDAHHFAARLNEAAI